MWLTRRHKLSLTLRSKLRNRLVILRSLNLRRHQELRCLGLNRRIILRHNLNRLGRRSHLHRHRLRSLILRQSRRRLELGLCLLELLRRRLLRTIQPLSDALIVGCFLSCWLVILGFNPLFQLQCPLDFLL